MTTLRREDVGPDFFPSRQHGNDQVIRITLRLLSSVHAAQTEKSLSKKSKERKAHNYAGRE